VYACLRVPADPTPVEAARLNLPAVCLRPGCGVRHPLPSGICGYCLARDRRAAALAERVNAGAIRTNIRQVGYRYKRNGKPVGGPAE